MVWSVHNKKTRETVFFTDAEFYTPEVSKTLEGLDVDIKYYPEKKKTEQEPRKKLPHVTIEEARKRAAESEKNQREIIQKKRGLKTQYKYDIYRQNPILIPDEEPRKNRHVPKHITKRDRELAEQLRKKQTTGRGWYENKVFDRTTGRRIAPKHRVARMKAAKKNPNMARFGKSNGRWKGGTSKTYYRRITGCKPNDGKIVHHKGKRTNHRRNAIEVLDNRGISSRAKHNKRHPEKGGRH